MKMRIAPMRSGTLVKVARRMAWRVMMPKKISTMFIQEAPVGVKCTVMRGLRASQFLTLGWLGSRVDLGYPLEESEELAVAVPWAAGIRGDPSGGDLQGGEQRGGAMAFVVVGKAFSLVEAHRE
ncbi:hypothetical protein [Amycolatopsis sp. NPDC102389]|uniref:hypothetical protein n=1 Tax=Amycolatopsis sp. NPDC102389 TaxID=3363941 RepID=UPI0038005C3F